MSAVIEEQALPAEVSQYATRRASGREHLRVVSPLRVERASRGTFILVVSGILAAGLFAMLMINTSLAQGAFAVSELQKQIDVLAEQEQALTKDIVSAAGPVALETSARRLGMVPNANPVFIDVEAGKILGKPKATRGKAARGSTVSVGAELPKKAKRNTLNGWSETAVVTGPLTDNAAPQGPVAMEATLVE